jgi:hypothetical protein
MLFGLESSCNSASSDLSDKITTFGDVTKMKSGYRGRLDSDHGKIYDY